MKSKHKITILMLCLMFLMTAVCQATGKDKVKENSWWKKREEMKDIYFPHNKHLKILKESGDTCMSCHPFSHNKIGDKTKLSKLTDILNEPLEGICHSCHVEELSATSECKACHQDLSKITPDDHNFNYKENHAFDSAADEQSCKSCHVNPQFCTDCHFGRGPSGFQYHDAWYIGDHGIDSRVNSGNCGKCHNGSFCADCHRRTK